MYDGVVSLCDGIDTMSDGTSEFYNQTSDLDVQVQNQIDEMIASISGEQTEVVSFVSDKNTNVDSVQFVIKTAAIEKADVCRCNHDWHRNCRRTYQTYLP